MAIQRINHFIKQANRGCSLEKSFLREGEWKINQINFPQILPFAKLIERSHLFIKSICSH